MKSCAGWSLLLDQPQGMPSILNHVLLFLFYLMNTSLINSVTATTSLLLDQILSVFFVPWLNRMHFGCFLPSFGSLKALLWFPYNFSLKSNGKPKRVLKYPIVLLTFSFFDAEFLFKFWRTILIGAILCIPCRTEGRGRQNKITWNQQFEE